MKRSMLVCGALLLSPLVSFAIVDSNSNGVSDHWEQEYNNGQLFGSFDPQADDDSDGWTNAQEAAAGTDPFNPNPPNGIIRPDIVHTPAVMGVENGQPVIITPEVVTVSWPTLVGKQYTLLLSPDLSLGSWIEVPDSKFIGDGDIHEFHFETSTSDKCFWRVAVCDVDSDEDGLTDAEEQALGTFPDDDDSDDDGSSDGEEISDGTDPTVKHSDTDDLVDGEDAAPLDPVINWKRTSDPRFAVIPLKTETGGPVLRFVDVSHEGTALMFDLTNTTDGSGWYSAFDANATEHLIPCKRPELTSPEGYFGSLANTLIDNKVLGERLVNSSNQECTWDLGTNFTAYAIEGYPDDFLDAHHGFFVRRKPSEDSAHLITQVGILNGSEWGPARVEIHGNICTGNGYWRYNSTNQSYGTKQALPENAAGVTANSTASATLSQTWPPLPPSTEPETHVWNLIMGATGLLCSKDEGAFTKSGLTWSPGTTGTGGPVSVTDQGWVACEKQIWANGQWFPLRDLLGTSPPNNATLLGMLDNGVGVARIEKTGEPSKLVLLLPVEVELVHTEPERDQDGNELTTKVFPGKEVLLRDEIADLRIKVPTLNGADWDMKIDVDSAEVKMDALGVRGNVQMYDLGTVNGTTITPLTVNANGTTKTGPYDLKLKNANGGQETIRIVVNKEGKFKITLKSSNNKIDAISREFSVRKRIRKYGMPYVSFTGHDPNRYDGQFLEAAENWGQFYQHPLDDVGRLKAMSVMESNVGAAPSRPNDILSVGHPNDPALKTIRGDAGSHDFDPDLGNRSACDIPYKWLNYPQAGTASTSEAIKWGTLWLYHAAWTRVSNPEFTYAKRNKPPLEVLASDEEPEYILGPWLNWDIATHDYNGPGDSLYMEKFDHAFRQGLHYYKNGSTQEVTKSPIWPILSDQKARPFAQP